MIPYKKMAKNKTEIEKYTEMNKNKKLDRFNLQKNNSRTKDAA